MVLRQDTSRDRDERGAVAIMVAVMAVMLFVVAALVVDLGLARDTKRQSQNAADASALAAGNVLYTTTATCTTAPCFGEAVNAAKSYALVNMGIASAEWDSCVDPQPLAYVPSGSTGNCISFDSATRPTRVRVRVPEQTVETGFGVLAGVQSISVATSARAAIRPGGALACGLCLLGSGMTHNIQNGNATVAGADIAINGNVSVGPQGLISTGGTISVEGSAAGSYARYQPDPVTGQPRIEDPLSDLVLPPASVATLSRLTNPCVQGQGIYIGNLNLRNRTCSLTPGLYVIAGGTWDLAGNASTILRSTAPGVTLYLACSSGTTIVACPSGTPGTLDASGNGTLDIDAPTTGSLAGLALVADRGNTGTIRLTGNGMAGITGTIYTRSGTLQMNGNGCASTSSAVIVNDLAFNGNNACLNLSYTANQNYQPQASGLHLDQ